MKAVASTDLEVFLFLWMQCPKCGSEAIVTTNDPSPFAMLKMNCSKCGWFSAAGTKPVKDESPHGFVKVHLKSEVPSLQ